MDNKTIDFNTKVVEMKGITKVFGSFVANDNIDLTVHKGEIHALLGENGAGKTTLMNILYGLYHQTQGEVYIKGEKTAIKNPNVAIKYGIGMVHQHFMLVHNFTVTENIILGMEPVVGMGHLNLDKARQDVKALSEKYGLTVDPDSKIEDISVGMQQRVEILKALYRGAEILILDEPTAVLTPQEIQELIGIMRKLTEQGKTIIIITHKLKEIKACADYCTVIRRGKKIDMVEVSKVSESDLASMMVGREVTFAVEKEDRESGETVLEIKGLTVEDSRGIEVVRNLNLVVREGEILGLAGIDGNGQTELVEAITGLRPIKSGEIWIKGKQVAGHTVREIFEAGICNIPEDRQKHGLVMDFTMYENMVLENYRIAPFSKKKRLDFDAIKKFTHELVEKFDVRPINIHLLARALSGGNQQKVIIAREVSNDPEVLIATQPTRGLDVGAIEFVHKCLVEQRDKGKAVLLVSYELDEILNVSDYVAVIYEGQIVGHVNARNTDENELGLMMSGGAGHAR